MAFSDEDVKKLAELSRIPLTDAEVAAFRENLGDILEYVEKLSRVPTDGVPETHGGGEGAMRLRIDSAEASGKIVRDRIVASFPSRAADLAAVPPVINREAKPNA